MIEVFGATGKHGPLGITQQGGAQDRKFGHANSFGQVQHYPMETARKVHHAIPRPTVRQHEEESRLVGGCQSRAKAPQPVCGRSIAEFTGEPGTISLSTRNFQLAQDNGTFWLEHGILSDKQKNPEGHDSIPRKVKVRLAAMPLKPNANTGNQISGPPGVIFEDYEYFRVKTGFGTAPAVWPGR